jgi:anaerobic selenocysteine-containing dehydrogenase
LLRYCPEVSLEISPKDARHLGIRNGDRVSVSSQNGRLTAGAEINENLPEGIISMPLTFPSGPVFELFGTALDGQSKAPALKSCAVRLERTSDND